MVNQDEYQIDPLSARPHTLIRHRISVITETTLHQHKNAQSIYSIFTPQELSDIEFEAWEKRKRYSAGKLARVYDSLHREALKGNVQAAKEYLDLMEVKFRLLTQ